jgi:hypothetical protein
LLGTHPQYKFYAQYFLAHSPKTVADKSYVIPSQEEFFKALAWLREQIFGTAPPTKTTSPDCGALLE